MFYKTRLENDMTLLTEQMGNLRSVTLGFWVKVGSRDEPVGKNGVSHFLEHMFFKGTRKRSARDIAFEMDSLGGEMNAYTSKEGTTFYVKVLDDHLEKAIELLSDIFLNSTFPEEDLKREKGVVREEINMVEDTPDEHIHDLFSRCVWGDNGLGQTVLGKKETVNAFSREDLKAHVRGYYGTSGTIVSCAGRFNRKRLISALNGTIGRMKRRSGQRSLKLPEFKPNKRFYAKDFSEAHVCLGVEGIRQSSPDRYGLLLLNTILGGGISSRLFQEIREKRGLAYSVYSYLSSYMDAGLWGVYAGTGRKKVNEVIDRSVREMRRLGETITEDELQRAKDQLKGGLILGLESTSRRMQNIAIQEIYYGRYYTTAELIRAIDSVTLKRVKGLAEELLSESGIALTVLGPFEKSDLRASIRLSGRN